MTHVAKPHLPKYENFLKYINKIYESKILTNDGPLNRELEDKLKKYLGVKHLLLVANGTMALQVAYKTLEINNKVITTPFSFVATTSSLIWEGLEPEFCDINKDTFNMDVSLLKEKDLNNVSAITPVHVFGNACEVDEIDSFASANNLKVIYDASHAFGVNYKGKSLLENGDISTISFHATKLFHTVEGGALIFKNEEDYNKARLHINFGYKDYTIQGLGVNAKMSELHAAMGLALLDEMPEVMDQRKIAWDIYMQGLGSKCVYQKQNVSSTLNYSYFPIILSSEEKVLALLDELLSIDVNARRYFYPSLDTLEYVNTKEVCKTAEDISEKIICLPIFAGIDEEIQRSIILKVLKYA